MSIFIPLPSLQMPGFINLHTQHNCKHYHELAFTCYVDTSDISVSESQYAMSHCQQFISNNRKVRKNLFKATVWRGVLVKS